MELFTVERYVGDSQLDLNAAEQESQRLEQLLKQAEGRAKTKTKSNISSKSTTKCLTLRETSEEQAIDVSGRDTLESVDEAPSKEKRRKLAKEDKVKVKTNAKAAPPNMEVNASCHEEDDTKTNAARDETIGSSFTHQGDKASERTKDDRQTSETLKPGEKEEITLLGGQAKGQVLKSVRRILPRWLANPYFFSDDVQNSLLPVCKLKCLKKEIIRRLHIQNIQNFFPVQKVVIPEVLSCWEAKSPFGRGGFLPPDICVCAPTGSGKTLAYVLPIVQLLSSCGVRRLEALVVVPTKDLASQVRNVFNKHAQGTDLKVGLANGLRSLYKEQEQLGRKSAVGYSSYINILVATPGRLVEHISSTVGFTLQYLRFFVIDEADRLLAEPYFGWLDKVYSSVYSPFTNCKDELRFPPNRSSPFWSEKVQRPLQKLLFSATLTQDPEKLAPLQLYRPKFFTVSRTESAVAGVEERDNIEESLASTFKTPITLQEFMYICNSGGKPLVLLYLLCGLGYDRVLCFTSSVESTHRLYVLVKHFGGIGVMEFSSSFSAVRRQAIIQDFSTGKIKLIICSDALARGLDLSDVQYVVSYDPPVSSKTYIHRVGRTARAGKTGLLPLTRQGGSAIQSYMWSSSSGNNPDALTALKTDTASNCI